jgi:hypothetical protein
MKPQEPMLPVVRCADEYFSTFGNPFEGTKVLKGLGLAIVIMLVGNALIALMESVGLMWLAAVLMMTGGVIAVGVYYFKPHPKGGIRPGEPPGPGISRAYYFQALACPHCGKPVGSTYSKQLILRLRCVHCGGEAKTDCSLMNGGVMSKV